MSDANSASARSPGTLYVVGTPLGNLGDMTPRAIQTLRDVRLIAAEDTRHTRRLLNYFAIKTRAISYHEHNRVSRLPELLRALSEGDLALVSDAGMPAISDPGQELVAAAAAVGHAIVAVPGPSAPITALAVSGIPCPAFHFLGFLPRKRNDRQRALTAGATWPGALVLLEAPHRLQATLRDLLETLGDRQVAVCCELTKLFEGVVRGPVSQAIAHYESHPPRGEFTVVVAGGVPAADPPTRTSGAAGRDPSSTEAMPEIDLDLAGRYAALLESRGDPKAALTQLSQETGRPRKALYAQLRAGRD